MSCCIGSKVSPIEIVPQDLPLIKEVRKGRKISIYQYNVRPNNKSGKTVTITQPYKTAEKNLKSRPTSAIPRIAIFPRKHVSDHPNSTREDVWYEQKEPENPMSPSQLETTIQDTPFVTHENTHAEGVDESATGSNNKTVIFMLHGVGGCAEVWKAQKDFFVDKGYQVVIPELIGHGSSSAPKDPAAYYFKEIAQDLLLIFDQCCKTENIVIAHSYGTCFASVLATERRLLIKKMILISGGEPLPLAPQPGCFQCSLGCLICYRPVINCVFNRRAFLSSKKSSKDKAFNVPTYVLKFMMNGQDWLQGDEDYYKAIDIPTLLIHGRQDELISADDAISMCNAMPKSQLLIVEEASHMVMIEQPQKINVHINRFVTQ